MVFLPEAADYIGESKAQSVELAERIGGDTISKYRTLAKSLGVWLSVGGFHQKVVNNVMFFLSPNQDLWDYHLNTLFIKHFNSQKSKI